MPARLLALFALLQAVAIVAPPMTWPLWKLRFGAIEGCLLGVAVGCVAIMVTKERWVAAAAGTSALICLLPALRAVPVYLAEGRSFSLVEWVTGGSTPDAKVERGVALGPTVTADIWRGAGEGPRPAVVVVHGGSWRSGAPGEVPHVSAALAAEGYTVVDVGYRLAGDAPFPAGIADVRCALVALAADPARFGIDPTRLALLGRSAGGQMALVAAYADATLAPSCAGEVPAVRGVVSLYGPTDMTWAHDHPYVPDVVDGVAAIELYLAGTPASAPDRYRAATPQSWVRPGLPPTLLLHGEAERCVRPENTTRLRAALVLAGVPVRAVLVPMADHGFDVRPGGFGEQLARGLVLDFLRDVMR
jgi:acetyl esterase/lipase